MDIMANPFTHLKGKWKDLKKTSRLPDTQLLHEEKQKDKFFNLKDLENELKENEAKKEIEKEEFKE